MELKKKKCVPCKVGAPPMQKTETEKFLKEIHADWGIAEWKKLRRNFTFRDFIAAMKFVNRVAEVAEAEGHHPDIHLYYNKLTLELWTHAAGGLTENDFILAAKIDAVSYVNQTTARAEGAS